MKIDGKQNKLTEKDEKKQKIDKESLIGKPKIDKKS